MLCTDAWRSTYANSKGKHYRIKSDGIERVRVINHIQNVNIYHSRVKGWIQRLFLSDYDRELGGIGWRLLHFQKQSETLHTWGWVINEVLWAIRPLIAIQRPYHSHLNGVAAVLSNRAIDKRGGIWQLTHNAIKKRVSALLDELNINLLIFQLY